MSTTIKEEKLMKKITSLILAIVMMLSMTVVSVYADENTMPLESVTDVASTYSTDDRNLAMFENERIYIQKTVTVTPNKGWGLWLILAPTQGSGCTITVYEKTLLGFTNQVKQVTLGVGEKIREKVVTSCNGRSYVITIVPTGDVTYIAGGITQTEKI